MAVAFMKILSLHGSGLTSTGLAYACLRELQALQSEPKQPTAADGKCIKHSTRCSSWVGGTQIKSEQSPCPPFLKILSLLSRKVMGADGGRRGAEGGGEPTASTPSPRHVLKVRAESRVSGGGVVRAL